jgi:phage terminase large subunit
MVSENNQIDVTVPYNFHCRDYQIAFFEAMRSGKKRAVLVWHRRAGKEKTCWNYLIMQACRKVGIYYYFFPHYGQGRKILWDGVDKSGLKFLDHIPPELIQGKPNSTEMKIRLKNGSLIQIIGSDNVDTIVGTNPIGCIFTEYSLQDPKAWQLIRPILTENEGWAVFNFTPRGANHAKDLYEMAQSNKDWFCELLTVDNTKVLTAEDIQKERDSGMSEDFIQQEFYCSFTLGVEGSYYAKYMAEAHEEGRISNVKWDKHSRVNTAWDIGYGDATAITFFQQIGQEIHVIDYYENQGEGLPHYVEILKNKPYVYDQHFAPHDIESHAFSSGMSAQEIGASLGIKFITLPTLKLRLEEGIEAVRGLFPRFWIDETNCKGLIKCLENYRKEFDEKHGTYKLRPRHDLYSHGCFTAGTKISCKNHNKSIEDIKTGDFVLTPNGYKKVLNTFVYDAKELFQIKTLNKSFTCTANHKIFTNEGLLYADTLEYNTTLYSLEDIELCKKQFGLIYTEQNIGFRESFSSMMMKRKLSLTGTSLNGMEDIIEERQLEKIQTQHCKDVFGHCTTEEYQKIIPFTIKTKILKTIVLKIWNACLKASILKYICLNQKEKNYQGNLFIKPWNTQKYGMEARRGKNGIVSTLKFAILESFKYLAYVVNVTKNIWPKFTTKNIAQINAKQKLDINLESIMKKEGAKCVISPLCATNIYLKERVVSIVPLHLQTTQKVYDFEVEKDHCYYANGILVSNSDSFRYLAIAVKKFVDNSSEMNDKEADRMYNKYHPLFE